jgi:hypothetical protein
MRSGVRPATVMRTLLQIPRELLQGARAGAASGP